MLSLGEFIHLRGFNRSLNANAPNIYVQAHENSPLNVETGELQKLEVCAEKGGLFTENHHQKTSHTRYVHIHT